MDHTYVIRGPKGRRDHPVQMKDCSRLSSRAADGEFFRSFTHRNELWTCPNYLKVCSPERNDSQKP